MALKVVAVVVVICLAVFGLIWFKVTDQWLGLTVLAFVALLCVCILLNADGEFTTNGFKWWFNKKTEVSTEDMLKNLKENAGSKLPAAAKTAIKGILKDSIKRGQLNEFLAANKLCPSLTKLNFDRYHEIGKVDELIALRALSLGLEIMLRNYCVGMNIEWQSHAPTPQERVAELKKRNILDSDAEQNYLEILNVIQKVCNSKEPRTIGEALSTCLEKTEELVDDYIVWFLKKFHASDNSKEIEEMRSIVENSGQ